VFAFVCAGALNGILLGSPTGLITLVLNWGKYLSLLYCIILSSSGKYQRSLQVAHRCIEWERVGDDGGEVVGVDRRHDGSPDGPPAPPEERGREPPSFVFLLGLPLRWEESFPSGPWPPWLPEGRSPSEIGSLSLFLFCFAFLFSGPSPFLIFLEIRNSDWAEILRGFLSRNYLSSGWRRAPTTLWGSHKPVGRDQGKGSRPLSLWALGHRLALILLPKNHIYSKINVCKFISHLDFIW
jgi:hypothetical protein